MDDYSNYWWNNLENINMNKDELFFKSGLQDQGKVL